MGIWGPGNFDEDAAEEHLQSILTPLVRQVREFATKVNNYTPDDYEFVAAMANSELLVSLSEKLGQSRIAPLLPSRETLNVWSRDVLARWDATIDELHPKPEFKADRRTVIEETLRRLAAVANPHGALEATKLVASPRAKRQSRVSTQRSK